MDKKKKVLSLLTALTLTTSAFAGLAVPANAAGNSLFGNVFKADRAATFWNNEIQLMEADSTTEPTGSPEAEQEATTEPTGSPEATIEATQEPVEATTNNSINISETFDTAPTNGTGYVWDVTTTSYWGGATVTSSTALSNPALSLSDNVNKTILAIANGAGGNQKDIQINFDASIIKTFGQTPCRWYLTFKSTDDSEMFKIEFLNGGVDGAYSAFSYLVVGDDEEKTNYSYTPGTLGSQKAYISFKENGGGTVTFGNVSADFANGTDLGSITVTSNGIKDWDRPFIIDNLAIKTVDKEKVTFNVTSDTDGKSVEGAVLTIGNDEYTVPASGQVEAHYLPGTYNYSIKLAKHKAQEGTLTVSKTGAAETVTTFTGIDSDINLGTLVHAVYSSNGVLSKVTAKEVSIANGTYSFTPDTEAEGSTHKYMLWNTLKGMTPLAGDPTTTTTEVTNDKDIELEYVGDPVATTLEIGGGEDYIYLPTTGTSSSKAFTATVYDQSDLVMDDAEVEWTLPGQPDTISVENGVVTVTPDYPLTDDNGVDVVVRATVKGTQLSSDVTIHIHNVARAVTWDIVGPAVIKDGTEATYTVENVKDQYGNDYTAEETYVLTSTDSKATIDGLSITPDVGTSRTDEVTLTTTLSGTTTTVDRTVTVYGYDFYEPGTVQASYGTPRMEEVNGVSSIVWPKSASAANTTEITLPTPVELTAGSAKMITFDNIPIQQTVGSQERSLHFVNSKGTDIIDIDFAGSSVVKDYTKTDGNYGGTEIGKLNDLGTASSATFVLKTDATGVTSAILSYNGKSLAEYEIGNVGDIAKIKLVGGNGAPDNRLLTLTNIIIADSNVPDVEIIGDDQLAKISGLTATKKFKGSIFSLGEDETYTWSVADESGNAIEGVTIDQNGVLSVTDAVAADTVAVISYTSSKSTTESPKLATHEVTIKDFATVESFDIDGPVAVNAGETVTYSVKNIIDQYGDEVTMPVSYAITSGDEIASIDAQTGVVTTTGTLGKYTVAVTVGNPGKTTTQTLEAEVAKYSAVGDADGTSVVVDVTALANYAADTQYLVTTATADGVIVNQLETASTDGKVTVDTTGAAKYEVSPIYSYTNVGNVASGKVIPLCDGLYDFTFKKSNGTRADIFVNGAMVGQNVDQYGAGRSTSGSTYTAKDVNVQGGSATVVMKDNDSNLDSIVVKKSPSIVPRKTHVYILGDSLVANYYGTFADEDGDGIPTAGDAQTGWGQVMDKFISSDLNVTNLAESGNYATGLQASTFPGVLANAKSGDYLIMECGYNDANYSSESKMATALEEIADDCEKAGITLILSTPNFGAVRSDTNSANVKFGPKMMEVAAEKGILGVNLSKLGYDDYTAKGWTSEYWGKNFNVYFSGAQQDNLHLSYLGAMKQASLVAQAIYDAQNDTENTELANTLKGLKINTQAYNMKDSEGATITLQVVDKSAN
jgi:lysophospholipase L1-like esterase